MKGRWRKVSYFAMSLPNHPGELARFADQLHAEGINLHGLWGYASGGDEPRLSCVPEVPGAFRRFRELAAKTPARWLYGGFRLVEGDIRDRGCLDDRIQRPVAHEHELERADQPVFPP